MNDLRTAVLSPFQVNCLSLEGEKEVWGGSSWQEEEPDHYLLMGSQLKACHCRMLSDYPN